MEEKQIEKIQKILTVWNPLKESAQRVKDLDNYRTEAIDIIFNLEMENKISASAAAKITREVLNQAFNLYLTKEECKGAAFQIYKAIKNK